MAEGSKPLGRRVSETLAWGGKGLAIRLLATVITSGALATIPAHYINKGYREAVGFDDAENQSIRTRFKQLRERKQEIGIDPKKGWQIPERLKHLWERLTKEFDGDIIAWAKEAEPILAMRIRHVQLLEYVDLATFYGTMSLLFLILLPRIHRTISTLTTTLRGKLLKKGLDEGKENIEALRRRVANLEKNNEELTRLAAIANSLMKEAGDDVTKLTPAQFSLLQTTLVRAIQLIASLPDEVQIELRSKSGESKPQ